MNHFAQTLREMIPFEQRRHSRTLTEDEATILANLAERKADRTVYRKVQVR